MATEPMEETLDKMMSERHEKQMILKHLREIANSADCGLYYVSQYSLDELKKKMKDIQDITKKALEEE